MAFVDMSPNSRGTSNGKQTVAALALAAIDQEKELRERDSDEIVR
jgi:hypothetical protein